MLGQCYLLMARAQYAQVDDTSAQTSLGTALGYLNDSGTDRPWQVCFARMLDALIRLRAGVAKSADSASEAYQCLNQAESTLPLLDRKLVIREAEQLLDSSGVRARDSAAAPVRP